MYFYISSLCNPNKPIKPHALIKILHSQDINAVVLILSELNKHNGEYLILTFYTFLNYIWVYAYIIHS